MKVLLEFLDVEPIENTITCLHFRMDKVILFGYQETIDEKKETIDSFLKTVCKVSEVRFVSLSHEKLDTTIKNIGQIIEQEKGQNNDLFIDITGGEELSLVAFGMLSDRYRVPIHFYRIPEDRLVELSNDAPYTISEKGEAREIRLTLAQYIRMSGGIINNRRNKSYKKQLSGKEHEDIENLWSVAAKHIEKWNVFSKLMIRLVGGSEDLLISGSYQEILDIVKENTFKRLRSPAEINAILDDLSDAGMISELVHSGYKYQFRFKNESIKECLLDGGSILELFVYSREIGNKDDCRVGVHLDWDGTINDGFASDVINEMDVLSIKDNILTFISCKSGRLDGEETLMALYELKTVADRFGGKYARKKLAITQSVSKVYFDRAEEMGIEIEKLS